MARKTVKEQQDESDAQIREQDIAFANNPAEWPRWPYLPVKKYVDCRITCALMVCEGKIGYEKPVPKVFAGNIYGMSKKDFPLHVIKEYSSIEEIFNDGWRVD